VGHSAKQITRAQKYTTVFEKHAISCKGTVMIKIVCIKTLITRAYTIKVLSWYLQKKIWFLAVAMVQNEFRI
jgi:hypothetical protein